VPAHAEATATTGPVIYADFASPQRVPVPSGYTDIDKVVASRERDTSRRIHLERARQVLAERLYADVTVTLAVLRLRKGWSQRQLADAAGTSQAHIARIESGREDVRLGTLRRIAGALGVSVGDVVAAVEAQERSG
jgi:DNA-binding Xre family transcriptional regulator